jgi:hypothetical protein
LTSSVVDANTLVDKHNPTPVLVRVCEEGLYEFAKVLLEKDATVSFMVNLFASYDYTVVSRVSTHGRLNMTHKFGPHGHLPGICMKAATLIP